MKFVCRVYSGKAIKREDTKLNIFPAKLADEAPQSIVVCTRYPISQKLLDEYLKTDQDLLRHRSSVLEQSDFYQFDQVFGGEIPQRIFYNHVCSSPVNEAVLGNSSTFFLLGSDESGKDYTLRGGENEDAGIMIMTIENLLQALEMQRTKNHKLVLQYYQNINKSCSIFTVNEHEMVDLIGNTRSQDIKQISLKCVADFKKIWKQSQFQLKNYQREFAQPQTQHLIVSLYIQMDQADVSQVNFISYSEFTSGLKDTSQLKQFISNINEVSSNTLPTQVDVPLANKTFEAIYLVLNQSRFQNITIIGQLSSTQAHFLESFRTLQFLDDVRPNVSQALRTKSKKQTNKQSFTKLEGVKKLSKSPSLRKLPEYQPKTVKVTREELEDKDFGADIGNIKSSIMDKIDKALSDSLMPCKKKKKKNININQLEKESPIGQQQQFMFRDTQGSLRHFQEIKELLKEKDKLEEHQKNKYEQKKSELKEELRMLKNKLNNTEELIKQRDHLISQLEQNLEEKRQQIDQGHEMFLSIKQKEGLYEKNQEELRDLVAQLNQQVKDQEAELLLTQQRLRIADQDIENFKNKEVEYIRHYESREDEFLHLLREERKRQEELLSQVDFFQKELRLKEENSIKLEESLRTLNKVIEEQQKRFEEERQANIDLREELKNIQKRTEDSTNEQKTLDHRNTKIRTKLEQELLQLREESLKYQKKSKNKITKLKTTIQQLQEKISSLKTEVPNIEKQSYGYQNELQILKQHNDRLNEAYQNSQKDLSTQSQQLQQAIEHLEKLTIQFENLQQEYERVSYECHRLEGELKNCQQMLERVCDLGHSQMDELDNKVSRMNQQIAKLQQEKSALLFENNKVKKDLQQYEENEVVLEKKLTKQMKENKDLRRQFKDMNQNLKEMIVEKHSEIKNTSKFNSNNLSYRSMRNRDNLLLSSNSKKDFLLLEEDSVSDI